MTLTDEEIDTLKFMDRPELYGVNMDRAVARSLVEKGLVEWLPPTGWSGTIYGLTDAGRAKASELKRESACPI